MLHSKILILVLIICIVIALSYVLGFKNGIIVISLIASTLAILQSLSFFKSNRKPESNLSDKLSYLEDNIETCKYTPQLIKDNENFQLQEKEKDFVPRVPEIITNADDAMVNNVIRGNRYLRSIEDTQKTKLNLMKEWFGEELDAEEDLGKFEDAYFHIPDEEILRWEMSLDPTSAAVI